MKMIQARTFETPVGVEPEEVNKLLLGDWLLLSHSVVDNETRDKGPSIVWVLIKPEKEKE